MPRLTGECCGAISDRAYVPSTFASTGLANARIAAMLL
jgi:hypothetical protein